jgi:hypothetical protein
MKYLLLVITIILIFPSASSAAFADAYKGRFVINPIDGQAWYVRPSDARKVLLGTPWTSFVQLRNLGEPISDADFIRISASSTSALAQKASGKILTKLDGSLWYLSQRDKALLDISTPFLAKLTIARQAQVMTFSDFAKIHKPGMNESIDGFSSYARQTVNLSYNRKFQVDVIKIDLANPALKIYSLAASKADCPGKCPAKNLASYVESVKGFAGINGSYFDTSASKKNYYFFPVYDQKSNVFINRQQLKYWTTGPIVAFDQFNRFYYFRDSRDFSKGATFTDSGILIKQNEQAGVLKAALGNLPKLIENNLNQLIDWALDAKQKTNRSTMNALGFKANNSKGEVWLVTVYSATLPEQTEVLQALGLDYALNLDGGGSAATIYNHEYMLGPGRDIPNAMVFSVN